MKIVSTIATAIAVIAGSTAANAESTDLAGIRVVGQSNDGTLVLDSSASALLNWETAGLTMAAAEEAPLAPTLLIIGHVENWDAETGLLTVSGQTTQLTDTAQIIDAPRDVEASLTKSNLTWYLHEGSYIAVAGDTFGGGENLATHIVRLDDEAQPGTVPLYIRGTLDLVDAIGIAYIGGMALDLNGTTSAEYPITGNVVELLAYQATSSSAVVSDFSSLEAPQQTKGSGLAGISGSGVRGISGSGVKGISGSGVRGISGSGVKGISGSGVRGISGSGVKGISGSGVRGISGSGVKGISGSGVRGISGSGVKGISGSGAK